MNQRVPVTVVIPAFNAEAVVSRALESVLRQTLAPAEIVVVDDGSSDGTSDVVRCYAERVRLLMQTNAGAAAARNRGIAAATHDWVALLDADDEWLPPKIETQLGIIARHPTLAWVGADGVEVRAGRTEPSRLSPRLVSQLSSEETVDFFVGVSLGVAFGPQGMLIRRRVFDEVGGFNAHLRVGEDRNMWWRIAFRYPRIGCRPEVLYRSHRETRHSLTMQTGGRAMTLLAIADALRAASNEEPAALNAFVPYAGRLIAQYRLREAAGEIHVDPATWNVVDGLFPPCRSDRLLMGIVAHLPAPVARRLARFIGKRKRLAQVRRSLQLAGT